jgi:hypothetical protein
MTTCYQGRPEGYMRMPAHPDVTINVFMLRVTGSTWAPGPSSLCTAVRSRANCHQDSGSQPAAGTCGPPLGGREGAPAWSAAWTAAATSSAVSASMTMFRRSSMRRTTCPACRGASCGPVAAGEGPVASGSVTPRTVEETVLARLLDTPNLRRLCNNHRVVSARSGRPADDHVVIRFTTPTQPRRPVLADGGQQPPPRSLA